MTESILPRLPLPRKTFDFFHLWEEERTSKVRRGQLGICYVSVFSGYIFKYNTYTQLPIVSRLAAQIPAQSDKMHPRREMVVATPG